MDLHLSRPDLFLQLAGAQKLPVGILEIAVVFFECLDLVFVLEKGGVVVIIGVDLEGVGVGDDAVVGGGGLVLFGYEFAILDDVLVGLEGVHGINIIGKEIIFYCKYIRFYCKIHQILKQKE